MEEINGETYENTLINDVPVHTRITELIGPLNSLVQVTDTQDATTKKGGILQEHMQSVKIKEEYLFILKRKNKKWDEEYSIK